MFKNPLLIWIILGVIALGWPLLVSWITVTLIQRDYEVALKRVLADETTQEDQDPLLTEEEMDERG